MNDINLDNDIECRICFDEEVDDELISPCRCNGTSKYIHRKCLNRWREFQRGREGERHCMECKEEYIVRRRYRWETENLFRRGIFGFICLINLMKT